MKRISALVSALVLMLFSLTANASWDIWQAYIITNVNGGGNSYQQAGLDGSDPTVSFVNRYYGRFSSGQSLVIAGGEVKTYKNGASNVCSARINYRVYRTCDAPGAFTAVSLPFSCNFPCSGLNNAGDQKWSQASNSTNVLSGLTASGTYVIEVYWDATGDDAGGCTGTKFASNGGVNYRAYFEYQVNDSFTDGDFTSNPTWSGSSSAYTVVSNSDAAGLIGNEATRSQTVRLNSSAGGTDYLSTSITNWNQQQEWYFFTGRRNQSATAANRTIIWLYADNTNLNAATISGYRIVIGDDVGNDEITLEKVSSGTATAIFTSNEAITNNIIDWGLTFKVTRRSTGRWTIATSTIPTTSGAGATAWSCPEALSTTVLTNSLSGGLNYVIDNTIVPPAAGTGYFGFAALHGSSANELNSIEFDNFKINLLPPDTYVQISGATSSSVQEDAAGLTAIAVDIFNASATQATTVQLVLTSGSATRFGGGLVNAGSYAPNYSTLTLTWSPGQTGTKYFYLDPDDNNLCDDAANITLQLQNGNGGLNAYVGSPDTYSWTIVDDNYGYQTLVSANFESGNLTNWVQTPSNSWSASNTTPISGTYSMRGQFTGAAGSKSSTFDCDKATLPGLTTTWRFNIQYNLEPNPANKFLVFLSSDKDNLFATGVNGYALGVNPLTSGDPDILTLWRVDNGNPVAAIVTTSLDWGIAQNIVGFEITRDENGLWTLKMDSDGNFDNLVTQGSGTETTYFDMAYFGARFIHTVSNGAKFAMDDISLEQKGCKTLYYSRGNGNWTDAIWSQSPSGGVVGTMSSGRYTRIQVQTGHTITANINTAVNEIQLQTGSTLNGGSVSMAVYGDWINGGTYNAQTGTVILKGGPVQNISGSSTTTFNNLTVRATGATVNCAVPVNVLGRITPETGTLQSGGNLVLKSTAASSGSIGPLPASGADVSGNVKIERYIPAANAGWISLACPVSSRTIADWDDNIIVTGITGANDGYNPPGYTWVNIYTYDETVCGDRNQGWVAATNVTNALSITKGYNVYMQPASQLVDVTGQIQKGNITLPLFYSCNTNAADGWNLVPNPYPSEIDWVALEGNSSDVATYYIYDALLPGYRTYNANTLIGSASRYIAHSQAFWVKSTIAGQTLNFTESQKSNTNAAFERDIPVAPSVTFRLEKDGLADEKVMSFIEGATMAFDPGLDAEYLENSNASAPEFAFVSSDSILMHQAAWPAITQGMSFYIYLDLPQAGSYTFRSISVDGMPVGSCMVVEDIISGNSMIMSSGSSMTITVDAPYTGNRLLVHVSAPINIAITDALCYNQATGIVSFSTTEGNWSYSLMDDMGANVFTGTGNSIWSNASGGHYLLTMTNTDSQCGTMNHDINVGQPMAPDAWVEVSPDLCNSNGNGTITAGLTGMGNYTYTLSNSNGEIVLTGQGNSEIIEVDSLHVGAYTLQIVGECNTLNLGADLTDPFAASSFIQSSADSVYFESGGSVDVTLEAVSDNATNFIWLLNGMQVGSDQVLVYSINTNSAYTFTLISSNNTCSTTTTATVYGVITTGVNEFRQNLSPVTMNQNGNNIILTFHTESSSNADVMIYNAMGQVIYRQRGNSSSGQVITIPMQNWSAGMYTVHVVSDQKRLFTAKAFKH